MRALGCEVNAECVAATPGCWHDPFDCDTPVSPEHPHFYSALTDSDTDQNQLLETTPSTCYN